MGVKDCISFKYSMHALTPMVDNDSISFKYSMGVTIALVLSIAWVLMRALVLSIAWVLMIALVLGIASI